jgi:hypothetical protein
MSSLSEQALALVAEMSLPEMLSFNKSFAQLLAKSGGSAKSLKAAARTGGGKKAKDPSAPKRALAAGTAAWMAYVKHLKETSPDSFEECKTEPERLKVAKSIRAEDEEAYKKFVAEFKESYAPAAASGSEGAEDDEDEGSDSEDEGAAAAAPAPAKKTPAAKPSAPAAASAKKPAASPAASPAAAPAKDAAAKKAELKAKAAAASAGGGAASSKPAAPAPAKKEVKKAAGAGSAPAKKPAAEKPAPVAAAAEEDDSMRKVDIAGTDYWLDTAINGLYEVGDGDSWGSWVGYYQPEDEMNPIRFTDGPEEE